MKRSAGILLWHRGADGIAVLLGHPGGPLFARRDDHHWSIPKGEYASGEQPVDAARREFTEETGAPVPPGDLLDLGQARQRSGKLNTIFALEGDLDASACVSNSFTMSWPRGSGRLGTFPEMDRFCWFTLPAARIKIFDAQLVFLDRLLDAVGDTAAQRG
ncbi:MAG TPA: NUDIX domain-containing protein [Mycobacteriales bacterium]